MEAVGWYKYLFTYYLRSRFLNIKRPLLGGMKITHTCNLKCKHCPFWKRGASSKSGNDHSKRERLSFSQAKQSMEELYKRGVRIVIIEGGEPLLWRDREYGIWDLVSEAKNYFFSVGLTTNGTLPIDVNSDIVWVSIDGTRELHNQIRGDCFDKIIANIKASTHPKIYAHITINSINWEEIPIAVKFLSDKVKGITIQFHYPYEGGNDELFLDWTKRRTVLETLIHLKKEGFPIANSYACLRALKDNSWRCHPWMIASVEPDGKITQGCYIKNRGKVCCANCGFSAHTEISLAYNSIFEAIEIGRKIFLPSKEESRLTLSTV